MENTTSFKTSWTIRNFKSLIDKLGYSLKSQTCNPPGDNEQQWFLRVYPKGCDEGSRDYVSLYLVLSNSNRAEVWANVKFCILSHSRKEAYTMKSQDPCQFAQAVGIKGVHQKRRSFRSSTQLVAM
jgi:hypothetical protein